jgi:hypothetical protein
MKILNRITDSLAEILTGIPFANKLFITIQISEYHQWMISLLKTPT